MQPAAAAKATCSFATVYKRNGVELCKILMTCPFNEVVLALHVALGQAFDYGMQAGAALAQVDVRGRAT